MQTLRQLNKNVISISTSRNTSTLKFAFFFSFFFKRNYSQQNVYEEINVLGNPLRKKEKIVFLKKTFSMCMFLVLMVNHVK